MKHHSAYVEKRMNVSEMARVCGASRQMVYKYLRMLEHQNACKSRLTGYTLRFPHLTLIWYCDDHDKGSDSEGRWFESSRAYVKIPRNLARFRGIGLFWGEGRICMRYTVGVHIFLVISLILPLSLENQCTKYSKIALFFS